MRLSRSLSLSKETWVASTLRRFDKLYNLGNARLGILVTDHNHVAYAQNDAIVKIANIPTRETLVVSPLEVDPQIPTHAVHPTPHRPHAV